MAKRQLDFPDLCGLILQVIERRGVTLIRVSVLVEQARNGGLGICPMHAPLLNDLVLQRLKSEDPQ